MYKSIDNWNDYMSNEHLKVMTMIFFQNGDIYQCLSLSAAVSHFTFLRMPFLDGMAPGSCSDQGWKIIIFLLEHTSKMNKKKSTTQYDDHHKSYMVVSIIIMIRYSLFGHCHCATAKKDDYDDEQDGIEELSTRSWIIIMVKAKPIPFAYQA